MPSITPTTYARWRSTTLGRVTEDLEVALVLELAGDLAEKRVLDVGTGDGTYAIAAAERSGRVTGLDTSRPMLDAAAHRVRARGVHLDLREGDVEQLPFADGSFDVVIAVTVLCFVSEPVRAVAEMARVLAPGGRLVIGELHRASTWALWRRAKGWRGSPTWKDVHFWSRRELRRLVEGTGLVAEQVRGAVHYPPIGLAARSIGLVDAALGKLRWPGGAFVVVTADKPRARRS